MRPARRVSGQRRYSDSDVALVGIILLLRDVGFSLAETKALVQALHTMASRSKPTDLWRHIARQKIADLDQRIATAQSARIALQHALACQHEDIRDCPNFARALATRLAAPNARLE